MDKPPKTGFLLTWCEGIADTFDLQKLTKVMLYAAVLYYSKMFQDSFRHRMLSHVPKKLG